MARPEVSRYNHLMLKLMHVWNKVRGLASLAIADGSYTCAKPHRAEIDHVEY
jgi:hypothetical protein